MLQASRWCEMIRCKDGINVLLLLADLTELKKEIVTELVLNRPRAHAHTRRHTYTHMHTLTLSLSC